MPLDSDSSILGVGRPLIFAASLFALYFLYFSYTGYHLPNGAGPDYPVSRAAVSFYVEHQRLAVYPQDKELMTFTKFGNSRVMRPPLAFATSAYLADISPWKGTNPVMAYRHGAALFCALTVVCCFLGFLIYFNRYWIAVLGASVIGLMPQFAFTASYVNDDSAAFFAASFLFLSKIMILKRGVNTLNLVCFGLAIGLVLISKHTAWILLPIAVLFYLIYVLRFNLSFIRNTAILFAAFIVGGGWWCVWNMLHYGVTDPFIINLTNDMIAEHVRVNLNKLGFKAQGLGFYDLILYNAKDFLGATFQATIGHIDWLRLRMSGIQYGYYYLYLCLGVAYLLYRAAWIAPKLIAAKSITPVLTQKTKEWSPSLIFEILIVVACCFQLLVYTWHNIHNDVQIQGKYLIPIVFPFLILSLSLLVMVERFLRRWPLFRTVLIIGLLVSPYLIHAHALKYVVIPFYWSS